MADLVPERSAGLVTERRRRQQRRRLQTVFKHAQQQRTQTAQPQVRVSHKRIHLWPFEMNSSSYLRSFRFLR